MRNAMFLNTTLTSPFQFSETESLKNLADGSVHSTTVKIIAKIAGVGKFNQTSLCPSCNRRITDTTEDGISCTQCKVVYPLDVVNSLFSLQLMVKDLTTKEFISVFLKNDTVKALASLLELDLGNEKQFVKRLFEIKEPIALTFDFANKLVSHVAVPAEEP